MNRIVVLLLVLCIGGRCEEPDFLAWQESKCVQINKELQRKGSISGRRTLLSTERAHSYKLKATWFTPALLKASARMMQIRRHLTNEQTLQLVKDADSISGSVMMIELDPNEGSGVIPSDWHAFIQVGSLEVEGKDGGYLRTNPVFQGVLGRNYDYDRLWVIFPNVQPPPKGDARLTVEIEGKRESVSWSF